MKFSGEDSTKSQIVHGSLICQKFESESYDTLHRFQTNFSQMHNNNLIIRNNKATIRRSDFVKNGFPNQRGDYAAANMASGATQILSNVTTTADSHRKVYLKRSSLPQIAIKRKNNDSPNSLSTEVVLLNGNWDTSNKIPNIIAEMHNVNIEELQSFQTSCASKHIKVDVDYASSPLSTDSGIEGDCSDGNLSWLLNYKIHELPPVPDCISNDPVTIQANTLNGEESISQIYISEGVSKDYFGQRSSQNVRIPTEKATTLKKEDSGKSVGHSCRYSGPKKPPFTYTELIEHALSEKGELTVSGIYQWISDHFPFYKPNDDRWKNSVRHNLSINPHFRKGSKAIHGAGHLWTLAQKDDKKTWNVKKQRMQQFMKTAFTDWNRERQLEIELATATASIMDDSDSQKEKLSNGNEVFITTQQISSGMRNKQQNVEVEYIIDVTNGLGDFLCPVSKEQVVEESGLGGDYLITDLNPAALGLNLSEAEIISSSNIYDDFGFPCYELQAE